MYTMKIRNSTLCLDNSLKLYIFIRELLTSGNQTKGMIIVIIIKTSNVMLFLKDCEAGGIY